MLVRSEVTGVRSSCEASATSRRWAACEACTRSSIASKRCAIRPTSSSPRAPMRRPRSPVASMCSAARVSSAMGRMTGRANRRASTAANAVPTQHEQHEHDPQAPEHGVDALQRAAELHRAQALDRDGDDAQVHAVGRAVGEERDAPPPPGRGPSPLATPIASPPWRSRAPPSGPTTCENSAGPPARRDGAGGAPPRRAPMRCDQLALRAQPAVDLRAQLAAHGQVADERRQRDRHAHGQGGHEHQAPAQGHGCSRST